MRWEEREKRWMRKKEGFKSKEKNWEVERRIKR